MYNSAHPQKLRFSPEALRSHTEWSRCVWRWCSQTSGENSRLHWPPVPWSPPERKGEKEKERERERKTDECASLFLLLRLGYWCVSPLLSEHVLSSLLSSVSVYSFLIISITLFPSYFPRFLIYLLLSFLHLFSFFPSFFRPCSFSYINLSFLH